MYTMIVWFFFVCLHVVILYIKRLSNKQHKPPYWWNTCSFLRLLHNKFNKGSEERTGQEEDEADRWRGVGAESDESEDGRHCMCCSVYGPHTTLNRTADDSKWSGTIRKCVCVCVSVQCAWQCPDCLRWRTDKKWVTGLIRRGWVVALFTAPTVIVFFFLRRPPAGYELSMFRKQRLMPICSSAAE